MGSSATNSVTFSINTDLKGFQEGLKNVQDKFDNLGKKVEIAFAALSAVMIGTTKVFTDFGDKVEHIYSLMSDEEIKKFGGAIKDATFNAVGFGFGIGDATDAMYKSIGMLGAGQKAIQAFNAAQLYAKATMQEDVAPTVEVLTKVMNTYTNENLSAGKAANLLFNIQRAAKGDFLGIADSIGRVAAQSNAMGLTFEQTGAALATMTKQGLDVGEATQKLSMFLVRLVQSKSKLHDIGIELYDANGKFRNFDDILADLSKKTDGNVGWLQELFGAMRGVNGSVLLLSNGMKDYRKNLSDITTDTTSYARTVREKTSDLDHMFTVFKGTMTQLAIQLGEKFAPAIQQTLGKITAFVEAIKNMPTDSFTKLADLIMRLAIAFGVMAIVFKGVQFASNIVNIGTALLGIVALNPQLAIFTGAVLGAVYGLQLLKEFGKDWEFNKKMEIAGITSDIKKLNDELEKGKKELGWVWSVKYTPLTDDEKEKAKKDIGDLQKKLDAAMNPPSKAKKLGVGDFIGTGISDAVGLVKEFKTAMEGMGKGGNVLDDAVKKLQDSLKEVGDTEVKPLIDVPADKPYFTQAGIELGLSFQDAFTNAIITGTDAWQAVGQQITQSMASSFLKAATKPMFDFIGTFTDNFNKGLASMFSNQEAFAAGFTAIWTGLGTFFTTVWTMMTNNVIANTLVQIGAMIKEAIIGITVFAHMAASAAYSAMAGIPFVGPLLGAAAYAATLGTILGGSLVVVQKLAGFAEGGIVPKVGNGDTIIAGFNPQEHVLTAKESSMIQSGDYTLSKNDNSQHKSNIFSFNFDGATFGQGFDESMIKKMFNKASEMINNKQMVFQGG